jgi:hypothetical protein
MEIENIVKDHNYYGNIIKQIEFTKGEIKDFESVLNKRKDLLAKLQAEICTKCSELCN